MEQTAQQERRIHLIPATKQATAPGQSTGRRQRVAAYCRVSTDSEEQLTSYTAQVGEYTNCQKSNFLSITNKKRRVNCAMC